MYDNHNFPILLQDRKGHSIYLSGERWSHALEHPGMSEELLPQVLETLREGNRKQDRYDPTKFKYIHEFFDLPMGYTHIVVVVKFSWKGQNANNFILTAYLIEKW